MLCQSILKNSDFFDSVSEKIDIEKGSTVSTVLERKVLQECDISRKRNAGFLFFVLQRIVRFFYSLFSSIRRLSQNLFQKAGGSAHSIFAMQ